MPVQPPRPQSWPTLPVAGDDGVVGVRRILCIGKNYAAHAAEMGDPGARPIHFTKSPDALLAAPGPVAMPYPPRTHDLHHELELVLCLGAGGRDVPVADAWDLVWGYAVGLDMTRRDLQAAAKAKGGPWASAKDFDAAAIVGAVVPATRVGRLTSGRLRLEVNGQVRQDADLSQMTWPIPALLAELSTLMTLRAGDLVFTGTPEGVGPVVPGDELRGHIEGVGQLAVTIA
ncbi:MAG: fumarylacetoacetate hydrolase family protein [Alphaproteobacteria bacterium]|nr:fumarylacetoacetate hydrolase family protein [Alphaproteobacteria bacterium]